MKSMYFRLLLAAGFAAKMERYSKKYYFGQGYVYVVIR